MEYSVEHNFEHDVEKVFGLFFNPEQIRKRHESLGSRELRIENCALEGTKGEIKFERTISSNADIPRALRKFHKEWNRVVQTENWEMLNDGAKRCAYKVEIEGVPAKIEGQMYLSPSSKGSVNKVSIKVSSKVPLLGKTIAGFICEDSKRQMEIEYQQVKRQLSDLTM